ncbi:MAG: glycoside hydrolase family 3 protein [Clostridiales bacterium]|nr:glycoside hydrolase family 3 protein [Clostridiales bacterium]
MFNKYRNPIWPVKERIAGLLGKMTLEEKAGQLTQAFGWKAYVKNCDKVELTEEYKRILSGNGIGSIYGLLRADPWTQVTLETGLSLRQGAEIANTIQKFVLENTRLGIPILFGEECSHGHMAIGATVFPVPIAMAGSWNTKLMERVCRAIAAETRAQGGTATYSPVLDVVHDPRWGRTEETFGEDPYLCSKMGEAAVKGLQGENLASDSSIVATIKHFAAYGAPEGGHNCAPVHAGRRELREVFLKPFECAVKTGAQSVMASYNEIDGIPCTCSRELLTDILRDEWGFEGFVISDMGAVKMLVEGHKVAATIEEAACMALEAGIDMEMSGEAFAGSLVSAVREGRLTESLLDRAVGRVLRVKFMLGLFENPFVDPDKAEKVIGCHEYKQLALETARECIILLKNEGRILPLDKNIKSIAVIGPNADSVYNQLGCRTFIWIWLWSELYKLQIWKLENAT